eukprot:31278-Pelagococcus_subviridis.AAC.8
MTPYARFLRSICTRLGTSPRRVVNGAMTRGSNARGTSSPSRSFVEIFRGYSAFSFSFSFSFSFAAGGGIGGGSDGASGAGVAGASTGASTGAAASDDDDAVVASAVAVAAGGFASITATSGGAAAVAVLRANRAVGGERGEGRVVRTGREDGEGGGRARRRRRRRREGRIRSVVQIKPTMNDDGWMMLSERRRRIGRRGRAPLGIPIAPDRDAARSRSRARAGRPRCGLLPTPAAMPRRGRRAGLSVRSMMRV